MCLHILYSMHVCMYVCMYVCSVYVCVCVRCVCVVCVYMCVVCVYVCMCVLCMCVCMCVCTYICACMCVHKSTIYIYMPYGRRISPVRVPLSRSRCVLCVHVCVSEHLCVANKKVLHSHVRTHTHTHQINSRRGQYI